MSLRQTNARSDEELSKKTEFTFVLKESKGIEISNFDGNKDSQVSSPKNTNLHQNRQNKYR